MAQPLTEQQIRNIVRQEIAADGANSRYNLTPVNNHDHDGLNSPQVNQADVIPGIRASGSITFAQSATTYKLGLTFKPSSVWFYGNAIHRTAGTIDIRAQVVGNAQLGATYYFQPATTTSTVVGGPQQDFIQSSTMFLIDSSTSPVTVRAIADEGNLIDVEYGGVIVARATVTDFNNTSISIFTTLSTGWTIVGNYVVT